MKPPQRKLFIAVAALAIAYLLYVALIPEWMIVGINFHWPW